MPPAARQASMFLSSNFVSARHPCRQFSEMEQTHSGSFRSIPQRDSARPQSSLELFLT
jgi:hypothetical protein